MMLQKDEVLKMARQAGFEEQFTRPQDAIVRKGFALSGEFKGYKANNAVLEAFAKLVDAKATAKEREACLKICEAQAQTNYWEGADVCAEDIRARGEPTSRGSNE